MALTVNVDGHADSVRIYVHVSDWVTMLLFRICVPKSSCQKLSWSAC